MSTQNNNLAISQPSFVGENGAVLLISDKEKKKQQEELLKLAAVLQSLESNLTKKASSKEGKIVELNPETGAEEGPNNDGPSNTAFIDAMTEMVLALQTLQVNITKFGQQKATFDAGISKEQIALSQHNLEKATEALQQIQNESWWQKLIEGIIAVVSAIAAIVTFNPELLVITVISVLAMTGAMSKITAGISDVLQDMGVPKDIANALSAAIVVIIVMIATLGTGEAAAAETAVDAAAEDGVEMADMAGGAVENAADSAANDTSSIADKLKALFKKYPRALMTTANSLQTMSSTGFVSNLAEVIMARTNVSKKEREEIEQILSLVVAAIAIIASLGTSIGMAAKSTSNIVEQMGAKFVKFSRAFFRIAGAAQAAGGVAEGGINISRGMLEQELALINANMGLIRSALDMNSTQMTQSQKHDADILKQQNVGNRSLTDLMKGEEGFAQLFTQHSPV